MASTVRFAAAIALLVLATSVVAASRDGREPQKRVEIIEVTLPQRNRKATDGGKAVAGEEETKYEIRIKQPNEDGKDSRKIKILVEAEDAAGNASHEAYHPVPLSIKSFGDAYPRDNLAGSDVKYRPTESFVHGERHAVAHDPRRTAFVEPRQGAETPPGLHDRRGSQVPPRGTRLHEHSPQTRNVGRIDDRDSAYNASESVVGFGSHLPPEPEIRADVKEPEVWLHLIEPAIREPQASPYVTVRPYAREPEAKPHVRESAPVYRPSQEYSPGWAESDGTRSTEVEYSFTTPESERKESGGRSIRDNSYSGFPESYRGNERTTPLPDASRVGGALPESPCPVFFKYRKFELNVWHGDIYVTTDEVLVGMRIDLTLDKAADVLTVTSRQTWSAEVKTRDNTRFTILSLKKKLVPQTPETVSIMIAYNEKEKPPRVKQILLNGRTICSSRSSADKAPVYQFPAELSSNRRTTTTTTTTTTTLPQYNRPSEYEGSTRRPVVVSQRPPSSHSTALNPVSYETDFNSNGRPSTKKPSRPNSNAKPASAASSKPQTSGSSASRPQSGSNGNYKPNDKPKGSAQCGVPSVQPRPLITNGQNTVRGQWPWHIALYRNAGANLKYLCGGNLVGESHIITAAHCVMMDHSSRPADPSLLLVYLGKFQLSMWVEHGVEAREVARVTVHPEYNATSFRSDIAVITLARKVAYNDFIRPVCLWNGDARIDDVVGVEGTVVGWGLDETEHLTNQLKMAKMPVVKQSDCLWSYPQFYPKFTSNTTFCAGFRNGTGACNGDSGGGMVFPFKTNNEITWRLRGIVSISPSVKDTRLCDSSHYVVFTDVARFLPWIDSVMARDRNA